MGFFEEECRRRRERRLRHLVEASSAQFNPASISEVAAGYFWDPAAATGSGSDTFLMPEGNGKTAYNMVTPSLAAAPVISTVNGRAAIQHINRTSPSIDSVARTPTTVTRGWTDSLMMAGWFSLAAATGSPFNHWRTNNNILFSLGNTRLDISGNDGVSVKENQHTVPASWLSSPVYIEAVFDHTAAATNRLQMWINRVQLAASFASSMGASLTDNLSFLCFSGSANDGSGFNISAGFFHGVFYLTRGIPSAANRDLLYAHRAFA